MPFGLGIWEILILAGVLVLLFGAKGAPGMARRLGVGVRELKDAVGEMDPRSVFDAKDEPTPEKPSAAEIEAPRPMVVGDAEVVDAPAEVEPRAEEEPPVKSG